MEKEKASLSSGENRIGQPVCPVSPSCGSGKSADRSRAVRKSFTELRNEIFTRLGGEGGKYFRHEDRAFALDLASIITETELLAPDFPIRIGGEMLPAGLVSEIFRELRCEHIETVISHYRENAAGVKNKKAYLRTALYNSVFEQSAELEETFRSPGSEINIDALFGKISERKQ